MQKKTEGICFAISAGICWGSMGVAAQVLMEDSGFAVGDLVAGRLLGAGALLLMFEHFFMLPLASEVFLPTRRSKRHPSLWRARTAHAADVFPGRFSAAMQAPPPSSRPLFRYLRRSGTFL